MRGGEVADLREPTEPSIQATKDYCDKAEAALEPHCWIVAVRADCNFHPWFRLHTLACHKITGDDGNNEDEVRLV